jgi:hypothetical protein
MSTPIHELEAQILRLDAVDRAHLLERLIRSFEPDSALQDAWVAEALRREGDANPLGTSRDGLANIRALIA